LLSGYSEAIIQWDIDAGEFDLTCCEHGGAVLDTPEWFREGPRRFRGGDVGVDGVVNLPAATSSVRVARAFVRDCLKDVLDADRDAAELIVSELVTNAVQHGSGEIELQIRVQDDSVFIAVDDDDPKAPVLRRVDVDSARGRGVFIVDHLARRWGTTVKQGDGKSVWAEIDRTSAISPAE
jgi:hypothetical protein